MKRNKKGKLAGAHSISLNFNGEKRVQFEGAQNGLNLKGQTKWVKPEGAQLG